MNENTSQIKPLRLLTANPDDVAKMGLAGFAMLHGGVLKSAQTTLNGKFLLLVQPVSTRDFWIHVQDHTPRLCVSPFFEQHPIARLNEELEHEVEALALQVLSQDNRLSPLGSPYPNGQYFPLSARSKEVFEEMLEIAASMDDGVSFEDATGIRLPIGPGPNTAVMLYTPADGGGQVDVMVIEHVHRANGRSYTHTTAQHHLGTITAKQAELPLQEDWLLHDKPVPLNRAALRQVQDSIEAMGVRWLNRSEFADMEERESRAADSAASLNAGGAQ